MKTLTVPAELEQLQNVQDFISGELELKIEVFLLSIQAVLKNDSTKKGLAAEWNIACECSRV